MTDKERAVILDMIDALAQAVALCDTTMPDSRDALLARLDSLAFELGEPHSPYQL